MNNRDIKKANNKLFKQTCGHWIKSINPKTGIVSVWNEPQDTFLFHSKSVDRAIEICIERQTADDLGFQEYLDTKDGSKNYSRYYYKNLRRLRRKKNKNLK